MVKPFVLLDAGMSASDALERLARNGFWLSPDQPAARARLESLSRKLHRPAAALAATLRRDPGRHAVAIRGQVGPRRLWHVLELSNVLAACSQAQPTTLLEQVMKLGEDDAVPAIPLPERGETPLSAGVIVDAGIPVAISLGVPGERTFRFETVAMSEADSRSRSAQRAERDSTAVAALAEIWPRIEVPGAVVQDQMFDVVIGFAASKDGSVVGAAFAGLPSCGAFDVDIELSADEAVVTSEHWTRTVHVEANRILDASASFRLVARPLARDDRPAITMLQVRYLMRGSVCGVAARPLLVLRSAADAGQANFADGAAPGSAITLRAEADPPDLTIEIAKLDDNVSSGHYVCRISSPHGLAAPCGPFPLNLGQDARTYARSLVDEVRMCAGGELLQDVLEGHARGIAQRLPRAVFDALREVAHLTRPSIPAVLIVSAEPFIPWELAWVEPPLDPQAPGFLGTQAIVGRWLRDTQPTTSPPLQSVPQRPAVNPLAGLKVRHMAVMAAWYKETSALRRLPKAEQEAAQIVKEWSAVPLAAVQRSVHDMLHGTLVNGMDVVGAVEAVHFAGHGDFDPTQPVSSALFLEDGTALRSIIFRSARYGGDRQPIMFLNACMLGIGGDMLGDMGGFPGDSLRGGFGGVIGALWEVNDEVARQFALEFWRRALPLDGSRGQSVGSILREMRSAPTGPDAPAATQLAYVYYGHPRLVLERATS